MQTAEIPFNPNDLFETGTTVYSVFPSVPAYYRWSAQLPEVRQFKSLDEGSFLISGGYVVRLSRKVTRTPKKGWTRSEPAICKWKSLGGVLQEMPEEIAAHHFVLSNGPIDLNPFDFEWE